MYFSNCGADLQEAVVLLGGAETHHVLDAGAVVPAAIEDHDLAGGREMLHVPLDVHLRSSRGPTARAAPPPGRRAG